MVCGNGPVRGLFRIGATVYGAGRERRQSQCRNRVFLSFMRLGVVVLATLRLAIWEENHVSYLYDRHGCKSNLTLVIVMK